MLVSFAELELTCTRKVDELFVTARRMDVRSETIAIAAGDGGWFRTADQ